MPTVSANELRRIGQEIFEAVGAGQGEAGVVADLLVGANLAGHDSHGVLNIPQYVAKVESGEIVPGASIAFEEETAATAVLNGNWGFGHAIAAEAMRTAVQKAREASVGIVTVHRCNHVGRLGGYPPIGVAEGMVGLVCLNGHGGAHLMAPWGSAEPVMANNTFAIGFPSDRAFPVVFDMTTSAAAGGKIALAHARKEPVPEGWLIDAGGNPTTDPADFVAATDPGDFVGKSRGALLPFGGPVGHKGSGLAFAFDILAGALSPAGCTRENPGHSGNALFVQAIRVEAFRPLETFKTEVGRFIDYVKSARTAPGVDEVLAPGERSHRVRQRRLEEGVPVEDSTWERIGEVAQRVGVGM